MRNRKIAALIFSLLTVVYVLAFASWAVAQSEQPSAPTAEAPSFVRFNIEFGGQTTILDSSERWTYFVRNRDIPKNFTLTHVDFAVGREDSPWSFTGFAHDATQLDARYKLTLEKFGKTRTEFRYTSWPNFISRLVQAPYTERSPGFFSLPDTIRGAVQQAFTLPSGNPGDPGVRETEVPRIINDLIANTPFTDLRLRRQRFWAGQELNLGQHWLAFVNVTHDRRGGFMPRGLGDYERTGTPQGGVFAVIEDELPEHVDYRTTEVRAGLTYHLRRGLVRVEYRGSFFQNDIPALRWTNPFQLTDQQADPPGGGTGRWRFAQGQLALPPDNHAHTVSILGRINLPAQSFLSALVAFSFRRQDEPFFPITLNTAITATTCPAPPAAQPEGCLPPGVTPTSLAALPRASLQGEVDIVNGDLVVGTRKWKRLLLTARYRAYNYDNQTPQLPLPGYAAFGESFWRTNITAIPDPTDPARVGSIPFTEFHEPNSFFRQQSSVEAVWKPNDQLQLKLQPTWEAWNREHRQVARTNDWGGTAQVIYDPSKWFNARIRYRYSDRIPQRYSPETVLPGGQIAVLEFSQLRRFDQTHRILHDAGVVVNVSSKGPWLFSANYNYTSNDYNESFFGLGKYLQATVGAELNYTPSDRYGLVLYYNHDRIRYNYRQIAKAGGANEAAIWNPANEWDRNTRERVDSFGIGLNASALQQKWHFNANYDLSIGRQDFVTFNPSAPPANMFLDATAFPWPEVETIFNEIRLDTSYRVRPNMQIGVRYVFEPFRLDDFGWDIVQPYMFGLTSTPDNNALRFLLLNSRYGDTNAHIVGAYVRYTF